MSASIPASTLEKFTTFGDLLRYLRRVAGLTQIELSVQVGYSHAQISRLEQNLRMPDIPTIEARFVPALGLEDEPKVIARLLELAANARREDAPGLGLCPYKGLSYFDESDADLFVGREALTAKLTERVLALTVSDAPVKTRFLAIVGASGSGKSSLVRAGLIPTLRWKKKSSDWQIYVLTPTAHPPESLAASLTSESSSVIATSTLADDLARDPRSLQIFIKRQLPLENQARALLVIDQFEEVFALCRSEEERAAFIGNLLIAASEPDGPVIVVITLRADFYAHCANYIDLREALAQNQEYIGAMNDEELRRAIEEPAQRGRWEFEPGLVDLLLHDVGREPGALPLLSHALFEVWQRRRGRAMTLSGYTSSGGVRGAIAETAETVFTDQFTREQRMIARKIFLRLTELGDENSAADTRRRATFNELVLKPEEEAATRAVLKALADARLIITSEDSAEVAHEALIREWPTLRGWLEENREGLRLHRQLTQAAQEWREMDHTPDILYRGSRLAQASEWASHHPDEMNELEREFLTTSVAASEHEAAEREAQRQRELDAAKALVETQRRFASRLEIRSRVITAVASIAVILALLTGMFGLQSHRNAATAQNNAATALFNEQSRATQQALAEEERQRAKQERSLATSRELAAAGIANLNVDPELSMLLALHALSETYTKQAEESLRRAVLDSRLLQRKTGESGEGFGNTAYSPDGTRLVTFSITPQGANTQVRDATSLEVLFTVPGMFVDSEWVDPNRLPTIRPGDDSSSQVITLWNTVGEMISSVAIPMPFEETIWGDFSRDLTQVALMRTGGVITIWDLASGQKLQTFQQMQSVSFVMFFISPDGKHLIMSMPELAQTKLLDIASGQEIFSIPVGGYMLAFAPDGNSFVTWDNVSGLVKIWDAASGQDLGNLPTDYGFVRDLKFNADGTRLFAVKTNGKIQIWDLATRQSLPTIVGVAREPSALAISPDNTRLFVVTWAGSLQLWDIAPGADREWSTVLMEPEACCIGFLSSDGTRFATSGPDHTIQVMDAGSGKFLLALPGFAGDQLIDDVGFAFSPDGSLVAASNIDNTTQVWNLATGEELMTLTGHTAEIDEIAFSTDNTQIATIAHDNTARLWHGSSGQLLFTLEAYSEPLDRAVPLGIAFSPDGRLLATAAGESLKIWDTATGQERSTLPLSGLWAASAAFSPDGERLAVGMPGGPASVWKIATGTKLFDLSGHTGSVLIIAFTADGTRIATGSTDTAVKLWDARTGAELLTLTGHTQEVDNLAFSPDGTRLTTIALDGTVRVWALRLEDLVQIAHSRLTRQLTSEECKKYLHVEQCPASP